MGLDKEFAAKFSFILSIPAMKAELLRLGAAEVATAVAVSPALVLRNAPAALSAKICKYASAIVIPS